MSESVAGQTRVLVLDDHGIVRQGIVGLLERETSVRVVGQASRLSEALAWDQEAEVILADLVLPDARGTEVVARLHERFPNAAILVLSMVDNPTDVRRAFEAGARGYLLKEAASQDLAEAVRRIAGGEDYLEPSLGLVLAGLQPAPVPTVADLGEAPAPVYAETIGSLTPREREILRLVALGHTNAEIAKMREISVRTVENHRASLMRKLGARTRAELVRHATESGLV